MTVRRPERVFVASTSDDLAAHRVAVIKVIRQMGLLAIAMEDFTAGTQPTVQACRQRVLECDVVVCILSGQYGTVPSTDDGGDGRSSFTRLEVETARNAAKEIPVLAFIAANGHDRPRETDAIRSHTSEADLERIFQRVQHLEAFKADLQRQPVAWFANEQDLATHVATSLHNWYFAAHRPGVPWPRGPRAINPVKLLAKLVRARAQLLPDVFRRGRRRGLRDVYVDCLVHHDAAGAGAGDASTLSWAQRDRFSGRPPLVGDVPRDPFPLRRVLDHDHRSWVVLGPPGGGKTTLLHKLALDISEGRDGVLPLLISARDLVEAGTVPEAIERRYGGGLATVVREHVIRGKAVVLIDGLDDTPSYEQAQRAVVRAAEAAGTCSVIVASRFAVYRGISDEFAEVTVRPPGDEQRRQLLTAWLDDEDRVARVLASLEGERQLRRLADNPLLLTLVGYVMASQPADDSVPSRSTDVYRMAVNLLLSRSFGPETHGGLGDHTLGLDALGVVALELHADHAECQERSKYILALRRHGELARRLIDKFGSLDQFLDDTASVTGLLVRDLGVEVGGDGFRFPHQGFREFLAGRELAETIRLRGLEMVDAAFRGKDDEVGPDPRLRLVRDAACGAPADWAEVIAHCSGLLPASERDRFARMIARLKEPQLIERLVATPGAVSDATMQDVVGFDWKTTDWLPRVAWLEKLPDLCADLEVVLDLVLRSLPSMHNGNDLWHARELLRRLADGSIVDGEGMPASEAVRHEAAARSRTLLDVVGAGRRESARALVASRMVEIPATTFTAGSPPSERGRSAAEGPCHDVRLDEGLRVMSVPVTWEIFELFDPAHSTVRPPWAGPSHPVTAVTWWECALFAEWLGMSLLDEREWEGICRAGTQTRFWSGDFERDLERVAWHAVNAVKLRTRPVGLSPPNPWGFHDVHGHVWEWCANRPMTYETQALDARHRAHYGDPSARSLRGGSFRSAARLCRSATRDWKPAGYHADDAGFRLVQSRGPEPRQRPDPILQEKR